MHKTPIFHAMEDTDSHLVRCRRCGWIHAWSESEPLGLLSCINCAAPVECINVPVHPSEAYGLDVFYLVPPSQRHKYRKRRC